MTETPAATAPSAPTSLAATAGDQQLSIAFTAGASGGSAITDYEYTTDNGSTWVTAATTASPVVITGLTNGTSYTVKLRAVNAIGNGTASAAVTETPAATAPSSPAPVYIPTTPQAALVLASSATTVEWGTQAKLTLTGGSGTGAVTYSSTGTTFCAVDRTGLLTPVSAGTCTVTANKDGDGTYGSAQSNSITITATDKPVAATASASNSGVSMVVGKPVAGIATVKFTVASSYASEKVSVILATKNSAGKTTYKTLGSATVGSTGAVVYRTKVKLPVGAVLQLKSAGTVILSKSIK